MAKRTESQKASRRAFVKKAAYIAPAILSLAATPGYATPGSYKVVPSQAMRPSPVSGK